MPASEQYVILHPRTWAAIQADPEMRADWQRYMASVVVQLTTNGSACSWLVQDYDASDG